MPSSFGTTTVEAFLRDLANDRSLRGLVIDCGANDGGWSREVAELASTHIDRRSQYNMRFVLVEPLKQFRDPLHEFVQAHPGSEIIAAAAWNRDGKLSFHETDFSEASSLLPPNTGWPLRRTLHLPTFDAASALSRWTANNRTLSLLKMDIEGAEMTVLPHLLLHGSLCHVDYLFIDPADAVPSRPMCRL